MTLPKKYMEARVVTFVFVAHCTYISLLFESRMSKISSCEYFLRLQNKCSFRWICMGTVVINEDILSSRIFLKM